MAAFKISQLKINFLKNASRIFYSSTTLVLNNFTGTNIRCQCYLFTNHRLQHKSNGSILQLFGGCSSIYKNLFEKSYEGPYQILYRKQSNRSPPNLKDNKSVLYIFSAIGILILGLSFAAVPMYRMFCQSYSYGGTVQEGGDVQTIQTMQPDKNRELTIEFTADAAAMVWNFVPQQSIIKVHPGETALAFYIARNPTDKPVIGISTYNVIPFDAGQYFNKIQCFCFEEQMLNPNEQVHMPVFFYIDPEFADDPKMEFVDNITLSYTFFEVKEGMEIPLPGFMKQ